MLLVGVISVAIIFAVTFYFIFCKRNSTIRQGTVVEVILRGSVQELPTSNVLRGLFFSDDPNLWQLGEAFDYASRDERVVGAYVEIHPLLGWSWAQIEELRDQIHSFRESGKPVHALLAVDMAQESELYLASAANSITLNPDAGLLVNGLLAETTFYKKTLHKLGIKPEFIQFKEYKSPEVYSREEASPAIREMVESIVGDLESRWVSTLVRERNLSKTRLRQVMSTGIVPADLALDERLVDLLGYKDGVEEKLSGGKMDEYRGMKVGEYWQAARAKFAFRSQHKVALVGGQGMIITGSSQPVVEMMGGTTLAAYLREIREEEGLKGVIFWVNSPGGSAVGSDMIWHEVELLEKADKPVVVLMSSVAGSGGYYISMGASRIVSQPSTITGSIGVIFGKLDLTGLYDWLGMSVDQVKLSPNADILSPFSPLTHDQRKRITTWMERIYDSFVHKVAQGRGMSGEEVELKARGRIYTGAQAKALGLVDDLGGLSVAISRIKEALHLGKDEHIELILYPRPKTLLETLISGDLFPFTQASSLTSWLENQIRWLETSSSWLLMPEVSIR